MWKNRLQIQQLIWYSLVFVVYEIMFFTIGWTMFGVTAVFSLSFSHSELHLCKWIERLAYATKKKSLLNDGMLDIKIKESLQLLLGNGWPAGNDLQVMKMIYLYHQYCCSHHQRQPFWECFIFLFFFLVANIKQALWYM